MLKFIVLVILIFIEFNLAYADQIFTTVRSDADNTIFDGRWTFLQEWKSTSEDKVEFDDGAELFVKTGHDYHNLYVLLDFISDRSFAKFADSGIVCIDSDFGKESFPEDDDYCFFISLESKYPITLRGNGILGKNNYFEKIENNPNLIAIGGISDKHDRYTPIPHTTYEFKIPIEIIGASSAYGFYVSAYDANTNQVYSWPRETSEEMFPYVPSPSEWGELISPDKSLPEFYTPSLVILLGMFLVLYVTRKQISFYRKI